MRATRKGKTYPEAALQKSCIKWFRSTYPAKLLIYVNNNSPSLSAAKRNKALGITAGFPDLFLFAPVGIHNGLAIELKAKGESPKPHQLAIHDTLRTAGYLVVVVKSVETFQRVVSDYLGDTLKS